MQPTHTPSVLTNNHPPKKRVSPTPDSFSFFPLPLSRFFFPEFHKSNIFFCYIDCNKKKQIPVYCGKPGREGSYGGYQNGDFKNFSSRRRKPYEKTG